MIYIYRHIIKGYTIRGFIYQGFYKNMMDMALLFPGHFYMESRIIGKNKEADVWSTVMHRYTIKINNFIFKCPHSGINAVAKIPRHFELIESSKQCHHL